MVVRASLVGVLVVVAAFAVPHTAAAKVRTYAVSDVRDLIDRSKVTVAGAAIVQVQHREVVVTANRRTVRRLKRLGFTVERIGTAGKRRGSARAAAFPPADAAYHDYSEMAAEVQSTAAAYPAIVSRFSLGLSHQGREIWAAKVSDNVGTDEAEPEVLFTANQHAREHLTVEMALYILRELTSKYATDARIKSIVDGREIWIVFMVNPDGVEYDIATGAYRSWRKNRQPNGTSPYVGTDLNRNWGFQWGCCGGSSGAFSSETYRGAAAFSAPETQRLRDFVGSRVVGGTQQIDAAIDFHTYSELVLWPYGYTTADTGNGITADDQAMLSKLGRDMAATNGYVPEQSSDLYIADGTINDWLWGVHRIANYTFEMYPRTSSPGFYPPDEVIGRETTRNREAVLMLAEAADCVYKVIGRTCGGPAPVTLFADDFEADRGWVRNAQGTDTATAGLFQRGDPAATTSSGAKQLGTTTSGLNDLVTGPLAGAAAGDHDVDGGTTTITSPPIALTGGSNYSLSFSSYLAHGSNATSADHLRVRVLGSSNAVVYERLGAATNRNGAWASATASLNAFAGQTVRLRIEATDAATASLVEAAVDDLRVTRG
jgi:murein tripeptide amidase MpaA